eukprot:Em0021g642a
MNDVIIVWSMASSARQALLLLLLIFAGRDGVSAQSGKNHTLYLLSLLAYPNNNTSLEPSISDGYDIIPGAHLAVSDINNRSDVLTDYRLELLTAADGCNVSWIAVVNLIDYLYYKEGKQIVGIVGPECSDSTKVVASITGRPEIALLNVHLGSAPELADRTLYPFSYGIRPPTSADVDAVIALFKYNKWTHAAVLYNSKMLVDYNSFLLFQEKIKGTANLTYTSSVSPTQLPLEQLRRSYVRVIVSFLRDETLKRVLCLAYFKNMTYPRYQWILFEPYLSSNASFSYESNQYECSGEQMIKTLSQSITIQTDNPYVDTSPISDIDDVCQGYPTCYVLFDAVWAIALALNNSIEPLRASGLSLSNYVYGKLDYTQIVKEQMNILSFNVYSHRKTIKISSRQLNHFAYIGCYVILIVGGTIYYITKTIGAETDVPYAILCSSLMIIVYLCIVLLFLPPVLPVMKEWPVVKKWPGLKDQKYHGHWLSERKPFLAMVFNYTLLSAQWL